MTLQQLGNLGEFVGGIAVIASLIYLAVQIRQNTQLVRSSTLATNTSNWSAMLVNLAGAEQSAAYLNGIVGKGDISAVHFQQFAQMARAMLISFESQHYQFLNGVLDRDIYLGYERACRSQMLAFPGFQMIWEITRDGFSPVFVELVDRLISEIDEGDSYLMMRRWQELARQRKIDRDASRPPDR